MKRAHACVGGIVVERDYDDTWWEYDAHGIELCRVCDRCRAEKLDRYRPEILTGYDQSDVDEPIEAEP